MIRRRKSNLPKWRYEFDCRKCDNIREVHDPRKGRDGDYCIPCIERMDSRRPSPIHADEKERVLRCECFTPIPEDEEEKNELSEIIRVRPAEKYRVQQAKLWKSVQIHDAKRVRSGAVRENDPGTRVYGAGRDSP